jgi:hypothetical protein
MHGVDEMHIVLVPCTFTRSFYAITLSSNYFRNDHWSRFNQGDVGPSTYVLQGECI